MSVTSVHQDVFAKDAGMSLTAIAEDGIRDGTVTGVQTCALPILETLNSVLNLPFTSGVT